MKNHKTSYIKIPTDYLEAKTKIRIPGRANQILRVIERKTFGWHKTEDEISFSQFRDPTGLNYNRSIKRSLEILKKMKIITFKNHQGIKTRYRIQRNYALWKTCGNPVENKKVLPSKTRTVTSLKNEVSTSLKNEDNKRNYQKKLEQRKKRKRKQ